MYFYWCLKLNPIRFQIAHNLTIWYLLAAVYSGVYVEYSSYNGMTESDQQSFKQMLMSWMQQKVGQKTFNYANTTDKQCIIWWYYNNIY